tara:strand:- start:689 stop:826 length:138 start_codon:yes stop_codon:yes gene_type:complete
MANVIIAKVDHAILENWKKAIVAKSPIEHPSKHHKVLKDALFQEC